MPRPGAEIQRAFADVNGDGLPDSVYTTAEGVFAFYNLGYGFTAHAVKLGGGGFESRESATGGAGLGFSLPYAEFGGGVNLLFNYDWSTYSWRDVNGDGILDQLRRASTDSIKVRFGTGSGLLPEVDYGNLDDGGGQPGHRRRRARRLRSLLGHRRRRLGDRLHRPALPRRLLPRHRRRRRVQPVAQLEQRRPRGRQR